MNVLKGSGGLRVRGKKIKKGCMRWSTSVKKVGGETLVKIKIALLDLSDLK